MTFLAADLVSAERSVEQALRVLADGGPYIAEEWMLLATLIGEADLALRRTRSTDPTADLTRLDTAIVTLRDLTSGFTDPVFLRSTKAARRRNPELFAGA